MGDELERQRRMSNDAGASNNSFTTEEPATPFTPREQSEAGGIGLLPTEVDENTQDWLKTFVTNLRRTRKKTFRETVLALTFTNRLSKNVKPAGEKSCTELKVETLTADTEMMASFDSWDDFDIFRLAAAVRGNALPIVMHGAMRTQGILAQFPINQTKLCAFAEEIASKYLDNPFHHDLHAADCTQTVQIMVRQIRGLRLAELDILTSLFAACCHDGAPRGHEHLPHQCEERPRPHV